MRARAVLGLFFLSGAAGLVYEVVWTRWAGTVLGNTTSAIGVVLAVFLGGLGAGAALGGRAAAAWPAQRLLRAYALIEAAVAVTAPLVPYAFRAMEPIVALGWETPAVPAAAVALAMLPPTLAMGATLPILARWLTLQRGDAGRQVALAYSLNTLGGVAGVLVAGFALIPGAGLTVAALAAAGLNVAVAAVAWALAAPGREAPPVAEPTAARLAGVAALVFGAAALVYEVAWTRALILSIGTSVQAFTVILAAFILGLGIGGALAARFSGDATAGLALQQGAVAVVVLAIHPLMGDLPTQILPMTGALEDRPGALLAVRAAVAGLLVLAPATLMGVGFPLACRLAMGGDPARPVGAVYAWNTVGAIGGSLAASFVLIPMLGPDRAIVAAACVNLALCAVLLRRAVSLVPAAAIAGALLMPRWDADVLASGVYIYGPHYQVRIDEGADPREVMTGSTRLVDSTWDAHGLVSVHEYPDGARLLKINGKTDASTGGSDLLTQLMLGHVPMLTAPSPRSVLVIGYGAGLSLGAVQRHPAERTACVELLHGVMRMAPYFRAANGDAAADPRLTMRVGDGRQLLRYDPATYDAIVSEPSNLWIRGMASLFTTEAFASARARLSPGGVMVQWVHAYRLDAADFRLLLRTFFGVFERGEVWETASLGDFLLVGRTEAEPPDYARVVERFGAAAEDLARVHVYDPDQALSFLLMDAAAAREFAGEGIVLTDDFCPIEFTAARAMLSGGDEALMLALEPYRERRPEAVRGVPEAVWVLRDYRTVVARAVRLVRGRDMLGALRELHRLPDDYPHAHPLDPGRMAAMALGAAQARAAEGRVEEARALAECVPPVSGLAEEARAFLEALPR